MRRWFLAPLSCLALCASCSSSDGASTPGVPDASSPGQDSAPAEGGEASPDSGNPGEDQSSPPPDANPDDAEQEAATQDSGEEGGDPEAELVIEQILVNGVIGEAAVIRGPGGVSVLIDTANGSHNAAVLDAMDRVLGTRQVDWVVVTHYHEDHVGGFTGLFGSGASATISKGVVTRGLVDFGADNLGTNGFQDFCSWMKDTAHAGLRRDLCAGPAEASCTGDSTGAPWTADNCDGLRSGWLDDTSDDASGVLSKLSLGGGAELTFFVANAHVGSESGVESAEKSGVTVGVGGTGPENARSLGAVLRWGKFTYVFTGDLTGGDKEDEPDVESFVASRGPGILVQAGGATLFEPSMVDVMHVSHHGYNTSTNQNWVDWLLPSDGQSRNAVVGTSKIYLLTPTAGVQSRVGERVGTGYLWVTEPGTGATTSARMRAANGSVVVRVHDQGDTYTVAPRTTSGEGTPENYASTNP